MGVTWAESGRVSGTLADITGRYASTSGVLSVSTADARRTDGAAGFTMDNSVAANFIRATGSTSTSTGGLGFWINIPSAPSADIVIAQLLGNSASGFQPHLELVLTTARMLQVRRYETAPNGGPVVLATSSGTAIPLNTSTYLEFYATIANTNGRYHVARNGVNEPGLSTGASLSGTGDITGAGVDTQSTGPSSGVIERFLWGTLVAPGFSGNWKMGGMIGQLTLGTFNNGILGNPEIVCVRPAAAGAAYAQQTALVGGANVAAATNETTPDGDTS